jgi:MFS family permease
MSAPIDAFAALRIPSLRAFALGRVSAVLGGQMLNVAVGWGLYERTGDPWSLALVGLFELAPVLVLTIPAGTVSDRYPRRNVALASHAFFVLASLGLLAASEYQVSTFWIYALLMLIGASRAFGAPSIGSMLPEIVPATHLVNANAWVSSSWEIASITGPALGGLLIAWTGSTGAAFAGGAIGHLAAAAWMLTIPATAPETRAHGRGAKDLFAGFRFIWRTPELLTAMSLDLVAVLIGGAVALLPVFAKDILKIGPEGLGLAPRSPPPPEPSAWRS